MLAGNPAVHEAVETIVRELGEAQATLTGARPAQRELAARFEEYLERTAQVRGKPALYPYIGSGLGNGPLVELADGSVKWDMISGIGVHAFGHNDSDIVTTALKASLSDTIQQGNLQFNFDSIEFSELLVKEAAKSSRIRHAFLANSGVMANESALKICYQKNAPASRVIAFADCFMGRSVTMAQIGDSAAGRVGIPLSTLVDYVPFYDPEDGAASTQAAARLLQQHIHRYPGQHACFVMELIQGEGGFNTAPREFFEALMRICRESKIAVWIDEVQTFGRTNQMFHFQQLELGEYIDVVTIGKLSQVCACLFTEDYNPKPGLLSGTFTGGSIEFQVGRRILERLRDGGYYGPDGRIARLQQAFRQHAKALVEKHRDWFPPIPRAWTGGVERSHGFYGGVGGMMRLTPFAGDKATIIRALNIMFAEGVIAFYCGHGPYHIRFLPPIGVMQPQQFRDVFQIVESALAKAGQGEGEK